MSERADPTATRVHDALTDLASSMPDHVLSFAHVEKAVRRERGVSNTMASRRDRGSFADHPRTAPPQVSRGPVH